MNKKTQQIVGALAILGLGYWAYTTYGKKKSFANLTSNFQTGVDKNGKPCILPQTPSPTDTCFLPGGGRKTL
jgi:hypothetical protein